MTDTGKANHGDSYHHIVQDLREALGDEDQALRRAIGGEFEAMGQIERDLLISQGLRPDGFVVDVGCGSGRLAHPLSAYLNGPYLGTDVEPNLLAYARDLVGRPDWRFELSNGFALPAEDATADIVCFFSVFTHLRHEESYRYLEEAKRILKPTGRIVFSFLEFAVPNHWAVFDNNLLTAGDYQHLNQFMSRDGIEAWAEHLELRVEMWRGDQPHIPLLKPVTLEGGEHYDSLGALGQSVAVMQRA